MFAPAGFIPTPAEKELKAQRERCPKTGRRERRPTDARLSFRHRPRQFSGAQTLAGGVLIRPGRARGSKYDGYLAWHARHGEGAPMTEKNYWRHRAEHEERNPQGRCC